MKRRIQQLVIIVCTVTGFFLSSTPTLAAEHATLVKHPPVSTANAYYVGNRAPLRPSPLIALPMKSIQARGWLRKQLELQGAGFLGSLGDISRFMGKEGNAWLSAGGRGDHGWEEVPYWLKGYILTAYLLKDPEMINEANVWIEGALASLQPNGWFGPQQVRSTVSSTQGKYDLWPNMVMLFCLQSYYEFTEDQRVLDLMTKYFRFELTIPDEEFLPPYWQQQRAADNLYSVYWLYNRTGEKWLLELAEKVHRNTANWTDDIANWHNVNFAQAFGGPTTYYMQSGAEKHLEASYRNYDKMRTLFGQVPGGMFGSDENCRPGFHGPRQAVETCGMVEMMLSLETLVNITGDLKWADRCEDVTFNSLPAALTADFKALRYLTAPNMPLSDKANKSPGVQNRGPMFLMNPNIHRCCQHNFGHGWPYYAVHLWFATPDNGLAAVFYNACDVIARVGDGTEVTIEQDTHYPFDERIEFTVKTSKDVEFPLYLRVPGWCAAAKVLVNGELVHVHAKPLQFIKLDRRWSDGDRVSLTLPMEITLRQWDKNQDSISVDRGPLTYSLKIGEKYVKEGGTEEWPAWEIHPTTDWNYGLIVDQQDPASSLEVVEKEWPSSDMPFTIDNVPLELVGKGKQIPEWELDHLGMVGALQASPVRVEGPEVPLTLIPMGAARLRISAFPIIGSGPDAKKWQAPPKPLDYNPTSSHCWGADTVTAVCDRVSPVSSGDGSIPRLTFWDHRGTEEWVQYRFDEPKTIDHVEVYWFDDSERGNCRPPASWQVLYLRDGKWVPVETSDHFAVETNKFNRVTFKPVTTTSLRLSIQLQPQWSGGILEWRID